MRLFQSVGPNPRVTTMFIAEKGIDIERAFIDVVAGENRQSNYLARNPMGGLPLLELDDGTCLSESSAICEYLEELHPTPPLIGATPEERARTRMAMRIIDQHVLVPMSNAFRSAEALAMFRDRLLTVPEAADGNKAYARDGLAKADAMLGRAPWLAGPQFTLADIMLFCFVDFGARVGQDSPEMLKNLAEWRVRVGARPSAAVSADPKHGLKEAA